MILARKTVLSSLVLLGALMFPKATGDQELALEQRLPERTALHAPVSIQTRFVTYDGPSGQAVHDCYGAEIEALVERFHEKGARACVIIKDNPFEYAALTTQLDTPYVGICSGIFLIPHSQGTIGFVKAYHELCHVFFDTVLQEADRDTFAKLREQAIERGIIHTFAGQANFPYPQPGSPPSLNSNEFFACAATMAHFRKVYDNNWLSKLTDAQYSLAENVFGEIKACLKD